MLFAIIEESFKQRRCSGEPIRARAVQARPATAAARRWIVREFPIRDQNGFVGGFDVLSNLPQVEMTANVARLGYTPLGRAVDLSSGARLPLAGTEVIRFTHVASARRACSYVTPGGDVGVCDPTVAPGRVGACVPMLPTGAC